MNTIPCFERCFKNPLLQFAKLLESEWTALKSVEYPCHKRIKNPYRSEKREKPPITAIQNYCNHETPTL
jgi:hypothetical protein